MRDPGTSPRSGSNRRPPVYKQEVDHPGWSRPVLRSAVDLLLRVSLVPARRRAGRVIPAGSLPRSLPSSRLMPRCGGRFQTMPRFPALLRAVHSNRPLAELAGWLAGWRAGGLAPSEPTPPLAERHGPGLVIDRQTQSLTCTDALLDFSTPVTDSRPLAWVFGVTGHR